MHGNRILNPILHMLFRDSCFTCDGSATIQACNIDASVVGVGRGQSGDSYSAGSVTTQSIVFK